MRPTRLAVCALVVCLALTGCGGSDIPPTLDDDALDSGDPPDAQRVEDASLDARPIEDASVDATTHEAGVDGGAAVDAGSDAPARGLDATVDGTVGPDAELDAPVDAPLDAVFDAPIDAIVDATDEADDAAFESGSDAAVDAGADAASDASVCGPITHTGSQAVTYQLDVAHDGVQANDLLSVPLCERWRYDFGEPSSYALVADGRVFVASAGSPSHVTALDEVTGAVVWGPVAISGTYVMAGIAYDGGRVFALNFDGELEALDAATGATDWSVSLAGQYSFTAPPTASSGLVFVSGAGSGGTVYGVDESSGTTLWTASVENGDKSSPALLGGGVFVSYACNQAYGFTASSGAALWHDSSGCEGGGGKTVAAYGGDVYTRDYFGNLQLRASDGAQLGTYSATYIPSFSGSTMMAVLDGVLSATPIGSGTATWTFGSAAETVVIAPIVVGPNVVVGTSSRVVVLSAADGSVVSTQPLPGIPSPDEQNVRELAGLTAADGMLFVPSGTVLVAY